MSETEVAVEKNKRRIVGRVISDKMDKTITVLVERSVKHPLYGKILRRSTKLHAHDEASTAKEGDMVALVETRPYSRNKHFKLVEVLNKHA